MDEDYLLGWIFHRSTLCRFGTKSGVKATFGYWARDFLFMIILN
jgi:hypothetical protein